MAPLSGAARAGLAVFEPPLPVEDFTLSMTWHARHDQGPATRHGIEPIGMLLKELS